MTGIVRLRVGADVRAHHAIAPMMAGLVVLAVLYGGGVARAEEAYGVSAVVLFPVMAWQVKILLDVEPDVQRRLVRIGAGSANREIAGGLLAASATVLPTIIGGLALPWAFHGVADVLGPVSRQRSASVPPSWSVYGLTC